MRQGWGERGAGPDHGARPRPGALGWAAAGLLSALMLLNAPAAAADPMSFGLVRVGPEGACHGRCVDVISAEGEIDNETAGRFVGFLSENLRDRALRPLVLIESPGGTVLGAMKLGAVFRKLGAAVMVAGARGSESRGLQVVPADCLSACVYAFMGGKRRLVPPVSRLGIHRMVVDTRGADIFGLWGGGERIYGSPEFVGVLSAYTKAMGVDPVVIAYAEQIAPEQIHILSRGEIRRWRLGSAKL